MRPRLLLVALASPALGFAALQPGLPAIGSVHTRASAARPAAVGPAEPGRAFTGVGRVRLVTGDTVRIFTRADGSTETSLTGGGAAAHFAAPSGSYLVPRTARPALSRVDLSLFDVTALAAARREGRVPVVIRFATGRSARSLPGLALDPRTARSVGHGSVVVHGSYGPRFTGLTKADLARIASIRLDAPSPSSKAAGAPTGPTHQVTVHVSKTSGADARFAVVTLVDVQNSDTFFGQSDVDSSGVATFEVPDGAYAVTAFTFSRVVMDPELSVTADRTVELPLSNATVKPQVTLPKRHHLTTVLSLARWPQEGLSFPFAFSGPRFDVRIQPEPRHVAFGSIYAGVSATFVKGPVAPSYDAAAVTSDVVRGVPDHLTFRHHRRDFAHVVDKLHANAPSGTRSSWTLPADGRVDLFDATDIPVSVPGRVDLLLEAGRHGWYQQSLFPQDDGSSLEGGFLTTVRRYRHAGRTHVIAWARGPVGPGFERRGDPFTAAIRRGDNLSLFIPMFSAAGSDMEGTVGAKGGSWSLRRGHQVLAQGHREIFRPSITLPAGHHHYLLTATSHPAGAWDLSTRVSDVWSFGSQSGRRAVPLLMPSYVAPQDILGNVSAGPTSYRLSFISTTPRTARIVAADVRLSTDDGHTWHPAKVVRQSPTAFRVSYVTPSAHGTARFLSVRVTGRDTAGNRVKETAIRAYRLR